MKSNMNKMLKLKSYRNLIHLAAVIVVAIALAQLGAPALVCAMIVGCYQLAQFAQSRGYRRGHVCIAALTEEQIKEFEKICGELKELGSHIPGLKSLSEADGGFAAIKKLPELLKGEARRVDEVEGKLKKLQKLLATNQHSTGVRWVGNVPFVTDECARSLSSIFVLECQKLGESAMRQLNREEKSHTGLITQAREYLGLPTETKAGGPLTAADIPLPTIYVPQIIELVFAYGAARQHGTVFPLGAGTVKLPRLQAGEDNFGFLGAGTAGMSASIAQKEVTATLVTFTANKFGGLIRIPTELEEDTFVPLGQFLARYIARQLAKGEDLTMFLADGSSTYANIVGIAKYCQNNTAYLQVLSTGHTSTGSATIADFRAMRTLVNPAVLANMNANGRSSAAYYLHPSFEALLVTFNTINNPLIYVRLPDGTCTLDGYPIHWIGVSSINSATVTVSTPFCFFGDLSYWHLGERGTVRVEVSKEVFFQTDELAMRALERIDVEAMAVDAMSTLQTSAS
jgi:HK97 family phage major capsid protein